MELPPLPPAKPGPVPKTTEQLRQKAEELEVVFLAQMLKSAGVGEVSEEFGGGIGEEQFASFLAEHQARAFAKSGGIGLAEHIFKALVDRQ